MKRFIALTLVLVLSTATVAQASGSDLIKTLIVDGPAKYHNWKNTTPVLKEMLAASGEFSVDVATFEEGDDSYKPDFDAYDLVVVNDGFGTPSWPSATERAFESYVENGGGVVIYHAANNAWPDWKAYNEMCAIGGWGGRNEKSGPYLYMDQDGKVIRDTSPGVGGGHGKQEAFEIIVREAEHPIMKGLPKSFQHGPDELYSFLRGPAKNVTILATAHSRVGNKGSGHEEPMLMVIHHGKGRIFHTVLGHDVKQIQAGSFVTTFLRGSQWAATGEVTIPVPSDFPNQAYPPKASTEANTEANTDASAAQQDDGFTSLFNGKNFDGWYLKIRSGDAEMAKKVFQVEDGMVHVFGDGFEDGYQLNISSRSETHGLFYANKPYSRYIFKFEYKWGTKKVNNFNQFQYDAGMYYHVSNDKIWPSGLEYQIRYNSVTKENHTGDFWGGGYDWYADKDRKFQFPSEGGKLQPDRGGEHRAKADAPFHALDGEWNQCEVIVMGNKYAIHKLNGEIVNLGIDLDRSEGKVGLQSETAEIFYRNIMIKEFDKDVPIEEFLTEDQLRALKR
ncbi:ThuA domain-containing protein [Novipirellula aureliae]|uniref:ThuA domain-containing protein n=1 Tax=Novipirellula aureliae TaxID=2527966 RepID=UPI001E4035C8|nr:family 16 glycoside hydrolase [Novipirellula aureliae]